LKTDYKENSPIAANVKLAVKILLKTMDSTTPSPERIEVSKLEKLPDGSLQHVTLSDAEVAAMIEEVQKEEEAKAAAEASASGDM